MSISIERRVPSAGLFMSNQHLFQDCDRIPEGANFCLPLSCEVDSFRPGDTCDSIEVRNGLSYGTLRRYNSWIALGCGNLEAGAQNYGGVLCISAQGGEYTQGALNGAPKGTTGGRGGG